MLRKAMWVFCTALTVLSVVGCRSRADNNGRCFDDGPTMTVREYVEQIRVAAMEKPDGSEFPLGIGLTPGMTTFAFAREFELCYVDLKYVSFRAMMMDDYGGNGDHHKVTVGTIDRATGRILGVADFVPPAKWDNLKKALHDAADKELKRRLRDPAYHAPGWKWDEERDGKTNLLDGEVYVTENFHYAKDGLHFVYNPYEISCGWMGDIEVIVDPAKL